jgi:hypothetical protein
MMMEEEGVVVVVVKAKVKMIHCVLSVSVEK